MAWVDFTLSTSIATKVYFVPGTQNVIVDYLSHFQNHKALRLVPNLGINTFSTPSGCDGGSEKMIHITSLSRQPAQAAWTTECLIYECSILLGMAIDTTTTLTYLSAANSYLAFYKLHHLPVDPTPETHSYYITFQSAHINPKSVESYLSGICSCLEPFFPDIRPNHTTAFVKRTLKGAHRCHSQLTV